MDSVSRTRNPVYVPPHSGSGRWWSLSAVCLVIWLHTIEINLPIDRCTCTDKRIPHASHYRWHCRYCPVCNYDQSRIHFSVIAQPTNLSVDRSGPTAPVISEGPAGGSRPATLPNVRASYCRGFPGLHNYAWAWVPVWRVQRAIRVKERFVMWNWEPWEGASVKPLSVLQAAEAETTRRWGTARGKEGVILEETRHPQSSAGPLRQLPSPRRGSGPSCLRSLRPTMEATRCFVAATASATQWLTHLTPRLSPICPTISRTDTPLHTWHRNWLRLLLQQQEEVWQPKPRSCPPCLRNNHNRLGNENRTETPTQAEPPPPPPTTAAAATPRPARRRSPFPLTIRQQPETRRWSLARRTTTATEAATGPSSTTPTATPSLGTRPTPGNATAPTASTPPLSRYGLWFPRSRLTASCPRSKRCGWQPPTSPTCPRCSWWAPRWWTSRASSIRPCWGGPRATPCPSPSAPSVSVPPGTNRWVGGPPLKLPPPSPSSSKDRSAELIMMMLMIMMIINNNNI